ncbi:MAG: ComEC/Rec2 family competence protein [Actinomycetaceae bacterium]|nr:ComEC/Rec2 family competence protein [Actinomycetaceae bacterium]
MNLRERHGVLDLRLLPVAAGAWIGSALGWAGTGWAVAASCACALIALSVGIVRALGPLQLFGAVLLIALAWASVAGARAAEAPLAMWTRTAGAVQVTLTGTVRGVTPLREGRYLCNLQVDAAALTGNPLVRTREKASITVSAAPPGRGARVRIDARVSGENGRVSGRAYGAPKLVSMSTGGQVRGALSHRLSAMGERAGSLAAGMLLGDRSRMSPDLLADMRASSLTHLTAVSGLHMGHVLAFALLVAAPAGRRGSVVAALALMGAYVLLVGPSGSVIRAATMATASLCGHFLARPHASVACWSIAITLATLITPQISLDLGFVLSASVTLALSLFVDPTGRALEDIGVPRLVATPLAVAVVAQAASTPLVVLVTSGIPPLGILANLLAAPLVAPAMLGGVIVAVSPALPDLFTAAAALPFEAIAAIASLTAVPHWRIPWPQGTAGAVLAALALLAWGYLVAYQRPVLTLQAAIRRARLAGYTRASEKGGGG